MKIQQFNHLLAQIAGCTFVSLDTTTVPALKGGKSNPHKDRVVKIAQGHRVMLFTNKNKNAYEAMVNRRRAAEGTEEPFVVAPLQWGEHLPNSPLIKHNGKLYLQMVFIESGTCHYELDGKRIDKSEVIGLPEDKGSGRQGLSEEAKVVVRAFALDSILAIRAFGEEAGNPLPLAA
jgi:hypothetical protein